MDEFSEIMMRNEILAKENRLLDSFMHREQVNPAGAKKTAAAAASAQLSNYQKYMIAIEELEYREKQFADLEQKSNEDISLLDSITEGIKIRIDEIRKETYEFKRDIVVGGANNLTGKIMSEKVVRYYENKLKEKTALIEKIKLKNTAMKNHRAQMDAQVKHKEEQGDSLHSIDFHQLQIENSQFNQKIKERNAELLRLKMTTGNTVQVLNTAKRNLNELLAQSRQVRKDIKERSTSIGKLNDELVQVQREVVRERAKNQKFKIQQSNPDMPQVLDYVNQKSEMQDLQAAVRNWQRKCEIAELAAKRARKTLAQLEPHLRATAD
jgi:hypothetical protein